MVTLASRAFMLSPVVTDAMFTTNVCGDVKYIRTARAAPVTQLPPQKYPRDILFMAARERHRLQTDSKQPSADSQDHC